MVDVHIFLFIPIGLFIAHGLPERCFRLDGNTLLLSTDWGTNQVLLSINVGPPGTDDEAEIAWPNRIKRLLPSPLKGIDEGAPAAGGGSVSLIDILNDVVLVQASSPSVPPFLAVATLPPPSRENKRPSSKSPASEKSHLE